MSDQERERIARAIFDADYPDVSQEDRDNGWQEMLAAMRESGEPTFYHIDADAVLPLIREAEARAWDACADAAYYDPEVRGCVDTPPNPYRDEGVRRAGNP